MTPAPFPTRGKLCGDEAGGTFGRLTVQKLALLQNDAPPPLAIERGIGEVLADMRHQSLWRFGHPHGVMPGDIHVVRETVVAPRRSRERRRTLPIERDVHDRRVEDRGLDGNRGRHVHDDVTVAQRVGKVLLIALGDVHRKTVARPRGLDETAFRE